jgi:hypothetical protein
MDAIADANVADQLATLAEFAALIGEEPAKLRRFVYAGVLRPDRGGRFPIVRSVEAYLGYWQRVVAEAEARTIFRNL